MDRWAVLTFGICLWQDIPAGDELVLDSNCVY
jgi:hypothetical protein